MYGFWHSTEYGPESKFRVSVHLKDEQLRNVVISYLGIASDFTEADFTLVLSPAISAPRAHEERPARFIGKPSLSLLVSVSLCRKGAD